MIKIGIFSDIHANLPALEAVLAFFEEQQCDELYHLGDAIAIGPYPREVVELLLSTSNIYCIMGNHDWWYVNGLPKPQPHWMSNGEVVHQKWTHQQLGNEHRGILNNWKFVIRKEIEGIPTVFTHYGLKENRRVFKTIIREPLAGDLETIFADFPEDDLIFYGHTHSVSYMGGKARYVNPGSVGCANTAEAPCLIATFDQGIFETQQFHIPYDDTEILRAFDEREVPERDFLREIFYGGRFPE